jgi:hypothetical protein
MEKDSHSIHIPEYVGDYVNDAIFRISDGQPA